MSTVPLEPPSSYDVAVQAHIAALRAMQQAIPGFTYLGPDAQASLNATASVSDRFLELVALACDNSPDFAKVSEVTGPELRDLVAFHRAYTTFLNFIEVLQRGLRHTLIVRRGDVGDRALRAYAAARGLNRNGRTPLVPELKEMGIALGRGRRRAAPVVEPPPTPPAPVPVTPPPTPTDPNGPNGPKK